VGLLSVSLASPDGTAVAGSDYAPIDVKLNFRPRETLKTVVVPLICRPHGEPDRNFSLSLSRPPPGVFLGRSTSSLWVLDDDRAGSVDNGFHFDRAALGLTF